MKKRYLIVPIVLILFMNHAQAQSSKDQIIIHQTLSNFFQAIADKDTTVMKSYCTNDIMLLENGEVWNVDTIVQKVYHSRSKDFKRINKLDFIETRLKGDIAWVTYYNQAEIIRNGQHVTFIKWLETTILVKESNRWKLRVLHSTLLKQ
jgi:ketosteroid isomerase-like protein